MGEELIPQGKSFGNGSSFKKTNQPNKKPLPLTDLTLALGCTVLCIRGNATANLKSLWICLIYAGAENQQHVTVGSLQILQRVQTEPAEMLSCSCIGCMSTWELGS